MLRILKSADGTTEVHCVTIILKGTVTRAGGRQAAVLCISTDVCA